MTSALIALIAALFAPAAALARPARQALPARDVRPARAATIFDNDNHMDANNIDMFVTNHGSFAWDLTTGNAGFVYPKGSGNTAVFAGGIWIGARVYGEPRLAIGEYSQEYVPGPMQNGTFIPDQLRFRNYRIDRGNTTSQDYLEWPASDGAPVDGTGHPLLHGDAMIWSVYNDADPALHTNMAGTTAPLGIEVQQTTFAFNRSGSLGNTIFLKFKLINKGFNTLDSAYVGVWLDPDLGGPTDDLVGCDVGRGLGYAYNATNADAQYGSRPPAVGLDLLQGPVARLSQGAADTLGMTTFIKYVNGTDPKSSVETYNYMRGLHADGSEIHVFDDSLQAVTTFQVSGLNLGLPSSPDNWLDSDPGDRRLLVASGPFTMGPGESQEIIAAIVVGQGSNRLESVDDMRNKDDLVQQFYESGLGLPPALAVVAPPFVSAMEGQPISFSVQASSPSGDPVTLAATPLPLGSSFLDHGNGTGDFAWTPDFAQAGSYTIQFTAAAASGSVGSALTTILVENSNRPPTADAGGPYSGVVGIPIQFDGLGSSDPDGDALIFYWVFGDGDASQAASPSHAYAYPGTYAVQLYVSDSYFATFDSDSTQATVFDVLPARVFADRGNRTIRLRSGRPTWCVRVESEDGAFQASDLNPASFVLRSTGTGVVDQIAALASKTIIGSDSDGNGVAEACPCFASGDLARLFSAVRGKTIVPIEVEGALVSGPRVIGFMDVTVMGSSGPVSAAVVPDESGKGARLEVFTGVPGPMSVRVFDVQGRLKVTLADAAWVPAGLHGYPLGSIKGARGIGFYRVETPAGTATGRISIAR
jgi:hypothetical protein